MLHTVYLAGTFHPSFQHLMVSGDGQTCVCNSLTLIPQIRDRIHPHHDCTTACMLQGATEAVGCKRLIVLAGLCQRRNWPDPIYQTTPSRSGYTCVVRVNHREYQTSKYYENETAAREAAALTAYTICRSFSVNDGMYPTGFDHSGVVQGRAVPVGTGRRHHNVTAATAAYQYRGESDSSRSGGSSPDYSHEPRLIETRRPAMISSPYTTSRRQEPRYLRHAMSRS